MSADERIETRTVEIGAEKEAEEEIKSQTILHKVTLFIQYNHYIKIWKGRTRRKINEIKYIKHHYSKEDKIKMREFEKLK